MTANVGYAKHAISIDENRADFKRVGWAPTAEKQDARDPQGNLYFEQVWFSGVHADIGGGYEENESRLSDIALSWMLAAASMIPNGLKHDKSVLRLHPDARGPQHNEQKGSWLALGLRKLPGPQALCPRAATVSKTPMKYGNALAFSPSAATTELPCSVRNFAAIARRVANINRRYCPTSLSS
jgi:hypothetical protein